MANGIEYAMICAECGTPFVSTFPKKKYCSEACYQARNKRVDAERRAAKRQQRESERRLDLAKDKRDGQQGYIMSEKDEKKKAARKKITPMDQWAEAKRNGCTLSYGQWQAQRYIEEMRTRGEE